MYDSNYNKLVSTTLEALHTENGSEAWSRSVDSSPIQVANGILYTNANPHQIVAYDAKAGKEL